MTVIMTVFGVLVFIVTSVTAGFKSAFKRLLMFMALGFALDLSFVALAAIVTAVATA